MAINFHTKVYRHFFEHLNYSMNIKIIMVLLYPFDRRNTILENEYI